MGGQCKTTGVERVGIGGYQSEGNHMAIRNSRIEQHPVSIIYIEEAIGSNITISFAVIENSDVLVITADHS